MWILKARVPPRLTLSGGEGVTRVEFFERLWTELEPFEVQGVVEGVVATEDSPSWVLDEAVPPEDRDLMDPTRSWESEIYFETEAHASRARLHLGNWAPQVDCVELVQVRERDWNAEWKSHFHRIDLGHGVWIHPAWDAEPASPSASIVIRIEPGAGFGTGTHETTQLCVEHLRRFVRADSRVLDFGSGSGVLAIAAVLMGAQAASGVEVDPLAIENARVNAALNGVEERIRWGEQLSASDGLYSIGVANILKSVLIPYAEAFLQCLRPDAPVILSGLLEADVSQVREVYSVFRPDFKVQVVAKGDWRALIFVPPETTK